MVVRFAELRSPMSSTLSVELDDLRNSTTTVCHSCKTKLAPSNASVFANSSAQGFTGKVKPVSATPFNKRPAISGSPGQPAVAKVTYCDIFRRRNALLLTAYIRK